MAPLVGIGPAVAQAKESKQAADYQDSPKGEQQCSKCRHFIDAGNMCERVQGTVSPSGWCKHFSAK
jgi:hypothetical protein